jgi:PAS domain-containing protein
VRSSLVTGLVRAFTHAIGRVGIRAPAVEENSHWRCVIESLGEGVIVLTASGGIQTANPEAVRILGLTPNDISSPISPEPRWRAVDEHHHLPAESYPAAMALRTNEPVIDYAMCVILPAGDR